MKYEELGKTGVLVSELALGTWRYDGGVQALQAGLDLGANFIDTAEAYGSEEVVGRFPRRVRRSLVRGPRVRRFIQETQGYSMFEKMN
jgi:aryl-alcohol dehydrogenase-like predicted oxidoreductase